MWIRTNSRKAVSRSIQLLKNANAPIAGLILNMLPNRILNGYYYSYYQRYEYYHYCHGHYGEDPKKKSKRGKTKPADVVS